ncbi:MAG: hypothetical protein PHR08_07810 [Bacteroidales bacterium]|nr:hypothetical protein [Bacteroidales bacterium]
MKKILVVLIMQVLVSCGMAGRILWRDLTPLLGTAERVGMYDFSLSHMNREIEGLLLVGRNAVNKPRFVLTSYFGISIFDLEGSSEGYQVHYVSGILDRKRALDLLWNDLSMLVDPCIREGYEPFRDDQGNIIRLRTGRGIRRTEVTAGDYAGVFPQSIRIDHPHLHITIELKANQNAWGSLYN